MFSDISGIPFLKPLIDNQKTVFSEYETAKQSEPVFNHFLNTSNPDFTNHIKFWLQENNIDVEQTGYDLRTGVWGAFPLYKKGFPINWLNMKTLFPYLNHFFEKNKEIEFACFMRLEAGQSIATHSHSRQHLIFHLLMNDLNNKGCEFTCGTEKKTLLNKGDVLMFDYSQPHSSYNSSDMDRIDLVIDFKP